MFCINTGTIRISSRSWTSLWRKTDASFEGNIEFYKHAGFVLASSLNIHYHAEPKDAEVPYFLAQELIPGYLNGIEGTYQTPKGYFSVFNDPKAFEEFEAGFPLKERLVQQGQIVDDCTKNPNDK